MPDVTVHYSPSEAQRLRKENHAARPKTNTSILRIESDIRKEAFLCALATSSLASVVEVAPQGLREPNATILEYVTSP
jgi:hypothetical protein